MRKILFIIIFIFLNIVNAGDDIQKIINVTWNEDISKRFCSGDCGSNNDCKNMEDICNIMVKLPIDTVDGEVFKLSLRVISSGITSVLNKAVEKNLMKFNDVVAFYVYLDDILPALTKKEFSKPGLMKFNKLDVVEFFIDTAIDIGIEHHINMMSPQKLQYFRSWPGIHDSASDDTIRQALKWMMKLIKNDIKASAMVALGIPTRAFQAGVADNAFLLLDIGIKTTGAAQEALGAKTDLVMSKKYGKMMNLFFDYEKFYYKLDKKAQEDYLGEFSKECNKIRLSFEEFKAANWAKLNNRYASHLNTRLLFKCAYYQRKMQETDSQKESLTLTAVGTMPRENYIKLINHFYPYKDRDYYLKLYDISNYDPSVGAIPNQLVYKYLKRLNAYGIKIPSKHFNEKEKASIEVASILLSLMSKNIGNKILEPEKILSNSGFTKSTKLTRQILSKLITKNYNQIAKQLDKSQNRNFIRWTLEKRNSSDIKLGLLGIINLENNNAEYLNNSKLELNNYSMAKILSNTSDILTCKHVGCSYTSILNRWTESK